MVAVDKPMEVGRRFGQLVVLGPAPKKGPHARSTVQCLPLDGECGTITTARNALLRDGRSWRCKKCSARASVETRRVVSKVNPAAITPNLRAEALKDYEASVLQIAESERELQEARERKELARLIITA